MAAKKKPPKDDSGNTPKVWRVVSQREGFRRAGWVWSTSPILIGKDELSDEQLALLQAEALLTIDEVDAPVAVEADDAE